MNTVFKRNRSIYVKTDSNRITAGNKYYEIQIKIQPGINPCLIVDKIANKKYADGNYCYRLKIDEGDRIIENISVLYEEHQPIKGEVIKTCTTSIATEGYEDNKDG